MRFVQPSASLTFDMCRLPPEKPPANILISASTREPICFTCVVGHFLSLQGRSHQVPARSAGPVNLVKLPLPYYYDTNFKKVSSRGEGFIEVERTLIVPAPVVLCNPPGSKPHYEGACIYKVLAPIQAGSQHSTIILKAINNKGFKQMYVSI